MTKISKRFAIDGVAIPAPSIFKASIADFSSDQSGRDMTATAHKDVVATKRSMDCEWSLLNWYDTSLILDLLDGKENFLFSYPDPQYPDKTTIKRCYVGDRTAPAYTLVEGRERWKGLAFSVIEV